MPACSTSCANPCSSRPPLPTCSRSSAARPSTCKPCSTRWCTRRRLCAAECAFIFRLVQGAYHLAASHGFSDDYRAYIKRNPISPSRGTLVGRTALTAHTVHLPDCLADPEYTWFESQKIGGFRTMLGVPLLREGSPIGVL